MKKNSLAALLFACLLVFSAGAFAGPWAVFANLGNGSDPMDPDYAAESIYTVDLGTVPPTIYGPFLEGQLIPNDPTGAPIYGGGLLDVTLIPGTRQVLVSNFGGATVYKVDLTDPTSPSVVGEVEIGFFAEDIAVTSDGALALVVDGALSSSVAVVDVATMTLSGTTDLGALDAQCVAIAPDNRTVLMCDYLGGSIVAGTINAAGTGVENLDSIVVCPGYDTMTSTCPADQYFGWPVNIDISPDGQTAIAADAFWGMVHVLRITGTGTAAPGAPFQVWGMPDTQADYVDSLTSGRPAEAAGQSVRFEGNGQAYLLQNGTALYSYDAGQMMWVEQSNPPDQLSRLVHLGPGQVAVGDVWFADLASNTSGGLFGVDTLELTGDGRVVAGNPAAADSTDGSLVGLGTGNLTVLPLNANLAPTGVAVLQTIVFFDPAIPVPLATPLGLSVLALLLAAVARRRLAGVAKPPV